jgi:endonuclease YncB( thermonuclease family)
MATKKETLGKTGKAVKIITADPETYAQAEELYQRARRGIFKKESQSKTITELAQKLQSIKKPV